MQRKENQSHTKERIDAQHTTQFTNTRRSSKQLIRWRNYVKRKFGFEHSKKGADWIESGYLFQFFDPIQARE